MIFGGAGLPQPALLARSPAPTRERPIAIIAIIASESASPPFIIPAGAPRCYSRRRPICHSRRLLAGIHSPSFPCSCAGRLICLICFFCCECFYLVIQRITDRTTAKISSYPSPDGFRRRSYNRNRTGKRCTAD